MNRRCFFRNLVIAAVSAPVIAKVLAEIPKPRINPEWVNAPYEYSFHGSSEMYQAMLRHVAENSPYAGLIMSTDNQPLRFNA